MTFPLLPLNPVTSWKHKIQTLPCGERQPTWSEQTVPEKCLLEARFLTFGLLPKCSAGSPGPVMSFQNKTQLLQAAPFQHTSNFPSLRTFRIDRTNTTTLHLCCFMSFESVLWPTWSLPYLGSPGSGRLRPGAQRGESPLPHGELTYLSHLSWGLNMAPAIPEGLCKVRSHPPAGRREQ